MDAVDVQAPAQPHHAASGPQSLTPPLHPAAAVITHDPTAAAAQKPEPGGPESQLHQLANQVPQGRRMGLADVPTGAPVAMPPGGL